ncbi:MAG: tRNA-specific adenosine deaminase [Opitutae bacterium]|nr:tRNA-specific adenosine deaminase [Opitutae bacterium]
MPSLQQNQIECAFEKKFPSQLKRDDSFIMKLAYNPAIDAYRKNEVPIGAVMVRESEVIASAHNEVESTKDPTAHAEILAITQAANQIGDWRLSDCTLYVTKEPCPMCAGAAIMARIHRLVYAVPDPKMGFLGGALDISKTQSLNHHPQISRKVLEGDCKRLLSSFFQQKRMVAKEGS